MIVNIVGYRSKNTKDLIRGDGIKRKFIIVILLTAVFLCFQYLPIVSAEADVNIEIKIVESEPRYHEDKFVLVAGTWHNIKITMPSDKPRDLNVILFKGDNIPNQKNSTNYYEWKYKQNSATHWESGVYYNSFSYIDINKSEKIENIYNFYVGIQDTLPNTPFYKEDWKIEIYENNKKIHTENLYIEKPTKGIAKSHGDIIYFYVDPFTEMTSQGRDYFTLKNTGNVPLDISISYSNLEYLLEFTNFADRIHPSDSANYHMSLHSNSWQPQLITDIGEGVGKVPENILLEDSEAFVFLKSALAINTPDIRVFVGHSKHELVENLFDIGLSFQYEKNIRMDEGDIQEINAYISGDGKLSLSIWTDDTENIRILGIYKNNEEINSPFDISSTSSTEQKITVKVEAIREKKSGDIRYKLESLDGRSHTYKTHIDINPLSDGSLNDITGIRNDSGFGSNSVITMVVVLSIFMVLGYMIISQIKSKRR